MPITILRMVALLWYSVVKVRRYCVSTTEGVNNHVYTFYGNVLYCIVDAFMYAYFFDGAMELYYMDLRLSA